MKKISFLLFWILLFILITCNSEYTENASKKFVIQRGTNISHWLSQSNRRGLERKAFFTEKDVRYLAGLGFDHLRIPVDEEQMWDQSGNMENEALNLLNHALDWCAEYNLRSIVDLHILRSHHFNRKENPLWIETEAQEKFIQCWRDLSSQLKNRPTDMVAYELMNEPVADDPEDWNLLVERVVKVIRKLEPDRMLVIGSNRWQSVDTFDSFKVPQNDANILLSFHMYKPHILTHYQASWTKVGEYKGPLNYPGQIIEEKNLVDLPKDLRQAIDYHNGVYNRDSFIKFLEKPLAMAKKYNLSLYCGEWGCFHAVPEQSRMRWYADVRSVLEEYEIPWTTWDYKGGFGIINQEGKPLEKLIKVLLD